MSLAGLGYCREELGRKAAPQACIRTFCKFLAENKMYENKDFLSPSK
jgi:hypothetical protein